MDEALLYHGSRTRVEFPESKDARWPILDESALMYTCSLIEFIGRERHLERAEVVNGLGRENLARIYRHADVLHSVRTSR